MENNREEMNQRLNHDCSICPDTEGCQTKAMLDAAPPYVREMFNEMANFIIEDFINRGLVIRLEDGTLELTNEGFARIGIGVN